MRGDRNKANRTCAVRVRRGMRLLLAGAVAAVVAAACATTGDRYAGMEADELWTMGLEAFEAEEWGDAIGAFEELVAENPGHPRDVEARMHVAQAYLQREEYLTAASEFERILDLYPLHALAPEASLGVCRAYWSMPWNPQRDQRYTIRGRDSCENTIIGYPGSDQAQQAAEIRSDLIGRLAQSEYEEGQFYQRRDAHNSAILIFEDVADAYAETEWAPLALLAMYNSYREMGWTPEATETAERLLASHPDSEPADRLRQEGGVPQEVLDGASADGP